MDVARPRPALALDDFGLNPLIFLKISVTRSHDQREMHEDVRSTPAWGNEPKALPIVELLHPINLAEGCHLPCTAR